MATNMAKSARDSTPKPKTQDPRPTLQIIGLGRQRYAPVWEMQRRFQQERIASLEGGPPAPEHPDP